MVNDCCREMRNKILARLQAAEKFDAQFGLVLPGDSALYIELWGLECAKGDDERAAQEGNAA